MKKFNFKKGLYIGVPILAIFMAIGFYVYFYSNDKNLQTYTADNYGYSFEYSKDFKVTDLKDGQVVIAQISQGDNAEQAIIIGTKVNDPILYPIDWIKGKDGKIKEYTRRQVGGQEAISTDNGDWVAVNSSDNNTQTIVAVISKDKDASSNFLKGEQETILNSFRFIEELDPTTLQCPAYYLTDGLREQSLVAWLSTVATTTLSSGSGFVSARLDFYINNNCTRDLEMYGYSGQGEITERMRQQLITNMTTELRKQGAEI